MNHNQQKPAEQQDSYSTGQTQRPKIRRSKLAILLMLLILVGGVITVMGIMNVRNFHQVATKNAKQIALRFSGETLPELGGEAVPSEEAETTEPLRLELSETPVAMENVPQDGGLSLQEIYDRNVRSVVSVICNLDNGTATGSGVVISEKGYLVTSAHILRGAAGLRVILHDGQQVAARIVGMDTVSDLAVLYVETEGLQAADFGDDSSLRVGDAVVAIGDPLGVELRGTMTNGIISAINRDVRIADRTMTLIQTDAARSDGNSGGPLINCYGQVVGIHTAKIGNYAGDAGVGVAIPSSTVKTVVDQLISRGQIAGRPRLGVTVEEVSAFEQIYRRYPAGLFVTKVEPGTDAALKGLYPGDILLSIDEKRLTKVESLQKILQEHAPGDVVKMVVYRKGQQHVLELVLSAAEE